MGLRKHLSIVELVILAAIGSIVLSIVKSAACGPRPPASTASAPAASEPAPVDDAAQRTAIASRLGAPPAEWRDGLAAVVLVDVSGSMADRVRDADGDRQRKIVIAQRAALDLVRSFDTYARAHPAETVSVGIFEFSARDGQPSARVVVAPGPPDVEAARARIDEMRPRGGTPIGEAMIEARRALDATGLRRRHLLIVTDGENTGGVSPVEVARVMESQEEAARAPIYFVAFDVAANAFAGVKQHGGLVLSAKDGAELSSTLDELLSDRILVEAPRPAAPK